MNSLIEKIKNIVTAYRYSESELIARKVMTAVLDHFSDPANVTDGMVKAICDEGADDYWRGCFVEAIRIAKFEVR